MTNPEVANYVWQRPTKGMIFEYDNRSENEYDRQ
jgi:hypothetical protein